MLLFVTLVVGVHAAEPPYGVTLKNAADPGLVMPAVGLGTGGYGNKKKVPLGVYPECWSDGKPDPSGSVNGVDCGAEVLNATLSWLAAGGRRIDSGDSYDNCRVIGEAMKQSGVPRSEIFLVSKIGSGLSMGVSEVDQQVDWMLKEYGVDYIDLVLIHWPTTTANSSDPLCQKGGGKYSPAKCRIDTWRQLLSHWKAGRIRAVGTSNYNIGHLTEIVDAKLDLPAVNQNPYNPHLATAQASVLAFCKQHSIAFNSYSPLGIPDWHEYPASISTTGRIIEEPAVKKIASAHHLSPAQILLAWQWGRDIVFNPRSMNPVHMRENLASAVYTAALSADEVKVLDSFKQDACSLGGGKNHWYECCGDVAVQPSIPSCD